VSQLTIESSFGPLTLFEGSAALAAIRWGCAGAQQPTSLLDAAAAQVLAFLNGERGNFDLPLSPRGSAFALAVWSQLRRIPYGQTRTYGEIARVLGSSPRAVGRACGSNPLPLVVPCHRVVGASGLGGYSGGEGVTTKRALLSLEATVLGRAPGAGDNPRREGELRR
jgi:methylated-DNA-[protein]-cysteine S-methyltransferase